VDPKRTRRVVRQTRKIDGWFSPEAAALFALLDEAQRRAGITGDLFEIGVHHGKSALLLIELAAGSEHVGACDIFGMQQANVSSSGEGDRAVFEGNVQRLAPGFDRLDIFEMLSTSLTPDMLQRPVRFFHIDGGHLAEEAMADLRLAAEVSDERGVIVVDDPWRIEWPGVTEAILEFLDEQPQYRPLVLGFNKLALCRVDAFGIYDDVLAREAWRYFPHSAFERKRIPIAGVDTTVFYVPAYRRVPGLDVKIARARSLTQRVGRRLRTPGPRRESRPPEHLAR
jgi:hypothetical protein